MATLFVRHDVADFETWKKAYDGFDAERKGLGVTGDGVYRTDGSPNNITLYHHFASLDQAKAFAGGERLREVMQGAGVVGTPEIWFCTKV